MYNDWPFFFQKICFCVRFCISGTLRLLDLKECSPDHLGLNFHEKEALQWFDWLCTVTVLKLIGWIKMIPQNVVSVTSLENRSTPAVPHGRQGGALCFSTVLQWQHLNIPRWIGYETWIWWSILTKLLIAFRIRHFPPDLISVGL